MTTSHLKYKIGDLIRHRSVADRIYYEKFKISPKNEFIGMIIKAKAHHTLEWMSESEDYNAYRVRWFAEPSEDPYWYEERSLELL